MLGCSKLASKKTLRDYRQACWFDWNAVNFKAVAGELAIARGRESLARLTEPAAQYSSSSTWVVMVQSLEG